jgi:hypothetical protein
MSGGLSQNVEDAVLAWIAGTTFPTAPTTLFMALYTSAPDDNGSGTEVAASGYTRQSITLGATSTDSGKRTKANTNTITFGPALADFGTIVAFGIWTVVSGGTSSNYIGGNPITPNKIIQVSDSYVFASGSVKINIDLFS